MRSTLKLVILIAVLSLGQAVRAADVEIDDPQWLKLPDEEKAALEKRLKESGALEADDKIVYTGGADDTVSETNTGILGALPAVGGAVCTAKHLLKLASCAKEKEPTACRKTETERYAKVQSGCK